MTVPKINSAHGSDTRNILNRAIDVLNQHGIRLQDLVAKGQLTPAQYAELIQSVNGLISKGEVSVEDIDKNKGKFDGTYFSSDFIQELNDGVISTTNVLPKSITSVELADKAINNESINDDSVGAHNISKENINLYNEDEMIVGYSSNVASGGIYKSENWSTTPLIPVKTGDVITFNKARLLYATGYDENTTVVSNYTATENSGTINVPSGISYIRINIVNADKDGTEMIVKNRSMPEVYVPHVTKKLDWLELSEENLNDGIVRNEHIGNHSVSGEKLSDLTVKSEASVNKFNTSEVVDGVVASVDGELNATNWVATKFIQVNTGDIVRMNLARDRYLVAYDDSKNPISQFSTTATPAFKEYMVTDGVEYIRINVFKDLINQFMYTINNQLPDTYENYSPFLAEINWLQQSSTSTVESEWKGASWVAIGDSITQPGTYQNLVKQKLDIGSIITYGYAGHGIAQTDGKLGISHYSKTKDFNNVDLVTIFGGTNDFKLNAPLGVAGEVGDTTFDNETFYGAYRSLVEHILGQNPEIKIYLWTPTQRDNDGYDVNSTNTAGHKLIEYVDAVKKIGQMYALPVLDLYAVSGLTKLTLSTFTTDGLHPNALGHERIAQVASSFLNTH